MNMSCYESGVTDQDLDFLHEKASLLYGANFPLIRIDVGNDFLGRVVDSVLCASYIANADYGGFEHNLASLRHALTAHKSNEVGLCRVLSTCIYECQKKLLEKLNHLKEKSKSGQGGFGFPLVSVSDFFHREAKGEPVDAEVIVGTLNIVTRLGIALTAYQNSLPQPVASAGVVVDLAAARAEREGASMPRGPEPAA